MKEFGDNLTPEIARNFLIKIGIINEDGSLAYPYNDNSPCICGSQCIRCTPSDRGFRAEWQREEK